MKLLITTLVFASLAAFSNAEVGPLSVQGNRILVAGKVGILRGISLVWTNTGWGGEKYYNSNVVNWLKADWKANVVRAAMAVEEQGGYLSDPNGNKNRVITVVDAAIRANMYVIIDWHSYCAHKYRSQAIAFFEEMARKYGRYNNVIYEIYNEPKDINWPEVKAYATAVVRAIRAIDHDNLIVVGTPTYSQDVDVAANDPITGFRNIAYALHFYSGTHGEWLRNKAATALSKNIALFVTEWGTVNADGFGAVATEETNRWRSFLKKHRINHCHWCICDLPQGACALKPGTSPAGRWPESSLTESGRYARDFIRNPLA